MSSQLTELLGHLRSADLEMAAFEIVRDLGGGVYSESVRQALSLFSALPCPATGVILVHEFPQVIPIIALANRRVAYSIPKEKRGPGFAKLDDWMASFNRNEKSCTAIHEFLMKGFADGTVFIGFHRMRNQKILLKRLSSLGMRKGLFKNGRNFLRDRISRNVLAYRCVVDQICIHGVDLESGEERFWNSLGAEQGPQSHLQSEVLFDLSDNTRRFARLIEGLEQSNPNQ